MQEATEPSRVDHLLQQVAALGWIDWTALTILFVFFVLGLFRGLVWQVSRIGILVLAYVFAGIWGEDLSRVTASWFSSDAQPELPLYVAYVLIFLSVLVAVSLVAWALQKLVQSSGLSFYNRVGGGMLGLATGALVVLALLTGVHMLNDSLSTGGAVVEAAERSHSQRYSDALLRFASDVLPEDLRHVPEDWRQLLGTVDTPPAPTGDGGEGR